MTIDINDVLKKEINDEYRLMKTIDELDVDEVSKLNIRERTYDQYQHIKQLIELENT
jgi:hypothetical protein